MKGTAHISHYYYIELKNTAGNTEVVFHSDDEDTEEQYYKFLEKKKAVVISANTKIKGFLKIHDGLATEAVNVIEESLKYV